MGQSSVHASATASLHGSAALLGAATRVVHPTAHLAGTASFLSVAVVHAEAVVTILGSSSIMAAGVPAQEGEALLAGSSTCEVDSFKIAILRYLPPVLPIHVGVPQPYPRPTGQLPRGQTQGVVLPGPPARTKIVGVRKPRN